MSERLAVKKVVQFATREYREKRPLSVMVLRVKPETFFFKGVLSSIKIRKEQIFKLIVVSEYSDYFRIYSFTKSAELLGAEHIEKSAEFRRKIRTSTK
ncbi:MAG: hypothetical protein GF311_02060, partial [Candidatus Lokiarchaeota archaeon]|nr:hypothetical protein [Candidatus Lokiarchaeota archaeon]